MATTVRITETYDLKTTVGKMGLIGIHTPTSTQIRTMYPGLVKNHRFVRLKRCDVVGACASVLPADPMQVGVKSGDVAPEDLFNPILYKPMSNESFETLATRIYQASDVSGLGSVNKEEPSWSANVQFNIYYSLLAESKKWRKAMPQRGFGLRGLYPICYTMINTYGNVGTPSDSQVMLDGNSDPINVIDPSLVECANEYLTTTDTEPIAMMFRGKPVKMPRIPLHNGIEQKVDVNIFRIPKTFVACLIVPPARLHEFYYRMRVSWVLSFEGVCTAGEMGTWDAMSDIGITSYANEYTYESSKVNLEHQESSVDADNVEINKIMES